MKSIIKHITAVAVFTAITLNNFAQTPAAATPQPVANLYDANSTTSWVSSFTGDKLPIELEVRFGSAENVLALMLQHPADAALADCKVVNFEVYLKASDTDAYPETPAFTGAMADNNTRQWFTFAAQAEGAIMLLRITSVKGAESATAALAELGVRVKQKNGLAASAAYDKESPATWNGITWSADRPYQVAAINWQNKSLMAGDFYQNLFPLLGENYNFTGTQINVKTGIGAIKTDETVRVYPNIVSDALHITCNSEIKTVEAVNLGGTRLPLQAKEGIVNVTRLPAGQYIIVVLTQSGQAARKIIKK